MIDVQIVNIVLHAVRDICEHTDCARCPFLKNDNASCAFDGVPQAWDFERLRKDEK